jgi:hypothetical protein
MIPGTPGGVRGEPGPIRDYSGLAVNRHNQRGGCRNPVARQRGQGERSDQRELSPDLRWITIVLVY